MQIHGLIELTLDVSSEALEQLVVRAYRASRHGTIGLALNGVPAAAVDRLLDTVVLKEGCAECGVRYLEDEVIGDRLLDLAARARFVIAVSERLAAALGSREIAHMRLDHGLIFLERGAHPLRQDPPAPFERIGQRGTLATI